MPPVDLTTRHDGTSAARVAEGTASSVPYMYMRQDMLTLASDAISRIDIATGGTRERLPRPAMTTRIRGTMAAGTPSAIADWPSEKSLATPPPRDVCEAGCVVLGPSRAQVTRFAIGIDSYGYFCRALNDAGMHALGRLSFPGLTGRLLNYTSIEAFSKEVRSWSACWGAILISTEFTQSVDQPQYELPWN